MKPDRLGKKQLGLLRSMCCGLAVIVPDKMTRRLCARGFMQEAAPDSFVFVTADGLRALADAADRGEVELFTMPPKARTASAVGTPEGVNQKDQSA